MKKIIIVITIVFGLNSFAQDLDTFYEHTDAFLKENVTNGRVAYGQIYKNPQPLNELLEIAEKLTVNKDDSVAYQAFWINAYNLSVIKGIIDNYPLKSPLDKPCLLYTSPSPRDS